MLNSRIPGKNFLFVPGPTNLPDRIVRAMSVASEVHRSPTFPDLVKPLFPGLKKVFGTEMGHAFIFPASKLNTSQCFAPTASSSESNPAHFAKPTTVSSVSPPNGAVNIPTCMIGLPDVRTLSVPLCG